MDSCPYYCEGVRETGIEGRYVPCCRHKHTPAPCSLAEAPSALLCGGLLGKCQIPTYLQLDIS